VLLLSVLISDINFITSGVEFDLVPFILLSVLNMIYLQDSLDLGVPYLKGNTEQRRRRRRRRTSEHNPNLQDEHTITIQIYITKREKRCAYGTQHEHPKTLDDIQVFETIKCVFFVHATPPVV
jgi:hypothetical protein